MTPDERDTQAFADRCDRREEKRLARVAEEPETLCIWEQEDEGSRTYETECGEVCVFEDGDPTTNAYRYCPYCGKPMRVIAYPTEEGASR